jgi:hypothetical protein
MKGHIFMEIRSFESVGDLRFGITREETHKLLGKDFKSFFKGPFTNLSTDAYDDLGLQLDFDQNNRVEFVEAWGPANITFNGIMLLGRTPKEVNVKMRAIGHVPRREGDELQFDSAGIVLTVEEGVITGVAAFRQGYYDNLAETTQEIIEQYRSTHPRPEEPTVQQLTEVPAAELRYCWRCREEVPMLNEAAHTELQALWNKAIEARSKLQDSVDFDEEEEDEFPEMEPVYRRYRELTGQEWKMRHLAPYHRLAELGPPCVHCGKPLRKSNATTCLECGKKQK